MAIIKIKNPTNSEKHILDTVLLFHLSSDNV